MHEHKISIEEIIERSIQLVALDLDGTLLRTDKTISNRNLEAVKRATEAGINIMAATGRPLNAIPKQFQEIPGIRFLMSANGANIYDLEERRTFYRANMTLEQVERAIDFLEPLDIWHEVLIDGASYVDRYKFEHKECYVRPASYDYIETTRTPVDSLRDYYRSREDQLEKICCFFREPYQREFVRDSFPLTEDLCALEASLYNYEIADHRSTKGHALRHMGELLDIPAENILAFGDGLNDADMLRTAGIGVAMGNAFPELQEMADYVTLTNDEDGVAVVLERLV